MTIARSTARAWAHPVERGVAAPRRIAVAGRSWAIGVALALGLIAPAQVVAAPEALIALEYAAPANCPSREHFLNQVLSRTRRLDDLHKTRLRVALAASGTGYVGTVALVDKAGNTVEREVDGGSCAEVAAALALIATVAVDQGTTESARGTERPQPEYESVQAAEPAVPAANTPAGLVAPDPAPTSAAAFATNDIALVTPAHGTNAERDVVAPHQQKTRPALLPMRRYSVGIVAGIYDAIAPTLAPALGLAVAYRPSGTRLHPEYRVAALIGWSQTRAVVATNGEALGTAEFTWGGARAAACPVKFAMQALRLGPCAVAELGVLRGNGTSARGEESRDGFWIAPGVLLDASLQRDPIRLRLAGGVTRPLVRDNFAFRPEPSVFKPPTLGLLAEVELAWTFD